MKALTICQPYATLIARGDKRVENRTWPTTYRGPLAIHAGKSRDWLNLSWDRQYDEDYNIRIADMPFGAIVAIANLIAVVHLSEIQPKRLKPEFAWLANHEHVEGPFCWILNQVIAVTPVPAVGKSALWEWTPPAGFALPPYATPPPIDQSAI